jgi:hypothetical protein
MLLSGPLPEWFTLHHLGGDAALQLEIAPIRFEGFSQVSLTTIFTSILQP